MKKNIINILIFTNLKIHFYELKYLKSTSVCKAYEQNVVLIQAQDIFSNTFLQKTN